MKFHWTVTMTSRMLGMKFHLTVTMTSRVLGWGVKELNKKSRVSRMSLQSLINWELKVVIDLGQLRRKRGMATTTRKKSAGLHSVHTDHVSCQMHTSNFTTYVVTVTTLVRQCNS